MAISAALAQPLHLVPSPDPLFVYTPLCYSSRSRHRILLLWPLHYFCIHPIPIRESLLAAYLRLHSGNSGYQCLAAALVLLALSWLSRT